MTRFVFKESLQISCKPIKIYSLKLVTFFILGRYLAGTICFNVSSSTTNSYDFGIYDRG